MGALTGLAPGGIEGDITGMTDIEFRPFFSFDVYNVNVTLFQQPQWAVLEGACRRFQVSRQGNDLESFQGRQLLFEAISDDDKTCDELLIVILKLMFTECKMMFTEYKQNFISRTTLTQPYIILLFII